MAMSTQDITIQLPEPLYRSASQLARTMNRPLADILQESLAHTLPPLDDVPPEEAEEMARLSLLNDADLWRVAQSNLPPEKQVALDSLLLAQNMGDLDEKGKKRLTALQEEYGRLLVRQSHAWLLLARRGYKVPVQNT
jgi:hypothetical protein